MDVHATPPPYLTTPGLMNRDRWLHENDVEAMVRYVHDRDRPRKLRLFLAACLRRLIEQGHARITDAARYLASVEMIEQMADGQTKALTLGLRNPSPEASALTLAINVALLDPLTLPQVQLCLAYMVAAVETPLPVEAPAVVCGFLRELYGDPFAQVEISPHWRTPEVQGLARGIYAERAFESMPVLADALLDAGCESEAVLAHCRAEGHLRGCWLVDGLLGR